MSDEESYEIPLQDQRVFGAGIKRKRVKFVPSSASALVVPSSQSSAKSISDFYLKLVLPGGHESTDTASTLPSDGLESSVDASRICEVCNLPLPSAPSSEPPKNEASAEVSDGSDQNPASRTRPHEASLAHQVCLSHSHPPSHIDRNRKGLAYLSSYGWDPDSRRGLGASEQGIQFPIKTKPKDDKMGIGVVLPEEADRRKKEKVEKLDAGKVRKLQEKDKKKAERLRQMFYMNDDVERYLGGR